ncbi:N-acetyltransferase [Myroides sp. WP-1]|uniref:N-acetyltransferase n=1 Tax=Myroides sp. WP-1 TaxID=2759944 RepID=UPI0015F7A8B3|nr:N-acetyltransferase [Myroides sp. WP-1]MBB1139895.1 N-acetyltransferase [Myroides sp. WP-1]
MIRLFVATDSKEVVELWYEASVLAHDFIAPEYWQEKKEDMAQIYIPNSETYVYEKEKHILGFVSLIGNYIAAIFVAPNQQGKGIGKELMQFVKQKKSTLELGVYAKNTNSIAFYKKQGFVVVEEKLDEPTGEREVVMEYK